MGRPKMKRNREPDEARKRKVEWSQSRKGTQMTCGNCCEPNHNVRSCYKEKCTENNAHSRKGKKPMFVNTRSKLVHKSLLFDHKLETQEFELYKPDVENEEDPPLRPKMICESELRAEKLKTETVPTGRRSYLCWTFADGGKKEKNQDDGIKGRGQPAPNDGSS
ncbi:hypothetical protein KY290_001018 [Solanum tuberosum]|uniref:Uncharacterized protein n=1 Tax=Solanum tuberosum TaxID=4113 RepID=A0ABQ7WL25_SOLTU|nr:hypothetical protein KY290_001018 [Solanum tuberosum]